MDPLDSKDLEVVARIVASASKIKLRGSVISKTSHVLIALVASLAVMIWPFQSDWMRLACVILAIGAVTYLWRKMMEQAERNPQASLLEGAEFLISQRIQFELKSRREISPTPGDFSAEVVPEGQAEVPPPGVSDEDKFSVPGPTDKDHDQPGGVS